MTITKRRHFSEKLLTQNLQNRDLKQKIRKKAFLLEKILDGLNDQNPLNWSGLMWENKTTSQCDDGNNDNNHGNNNHNDNNNTIIMKLIRIQRTI